MPVFITGGTGFIGASVVRELRRRTHVVRALARSDAAAEKLRELGAEPVRGEMRDLQRGASVPYVEVAHAASRAAGREGRVVHVALEDARAQMGPYADALACDLQLDCGKAVRELGWEPHRPTLLEEFANTSVI
jgi:nucleoside-diphosphate-sugar epimerase